MTSTSETSSLASQGEQRVKHVIVHANSGPLNIKSFDLLTTLEIISALPVLQAFPFKIGLPLITSATAVTAMYINNHFRKSLLLLHHMKVSSYIGMIIVPALTGSIVFTQVISDDILQQRTKCSVCLQTKAAMVQAGFGVLYPLILAPLVNFPTATALQGVYMPKVTKKPLELMKYAFEIIKPIGGKLRVLTLCHIIVAMGIAHFQFDNFHSTVLPYLTEGRPKNTKPRLP